MDRLIEDYAVHLVEPGCAPGSGRWGALATMPGDISEVFPYLNEVLPDARYDHESRTLIWAEGEEIYALRPREISVARAGDLAEAEQTVRKLVARINRVWAERSTIKPRFTERKLAPVIEIYKLLPRSNCRQCGYPTCLAYAADLRKGTAKPEQCHPLPEPERQRLAALLARD